jgi:hypothetical protein
LAVAVVDSLYPIDTARPSVLLLRCYFLMAVTDRLYASNAENAERIRALILSDDGSTVDGTECDIDCVEPREGDREGA